MRVLRFLRPLGVSAVMLAAGCSTTTPAFTPVGQASGVGLALPLRRGLPRAAKAGLYVGEFYGTSVYGFRRSGKGAAVCAITGLSSVNDLASDAKGDLIEPDGGARELRIFRPQCGAVLGTVSDAYGQPADAMSADATNGT
ncbi:MAG TPA: hypothetical protein VHS56_13690, partial [Candidatus Cybelea sp.]|nr:hypothetical protein [Candidatus Cybelea sp.]